MERFDSATDAEADGGTSMADASATDMVEAGAAAAEAAGGGGSSAALLSLLSSTMVGAAPPPPPADMSLTSKWGSTLAKRVR